MPSSEKTKKGESPFAPLIATNIGSLVYSLPSLPAFIVISYSTVSSLVKKSYLFFLSRIPAHLNSKFLEPSSIMILSHINIPSFINLKYYLYHPLKFLLIKFLQQMAYRMLLHNFHQA